MTSYSNDGYCYTSTYNNENDALSCNGRKTNITLQNGGEYGMINSGSKTNSDVLGYVNSYGNNESFSYCSTASYKDNNMIYDQNITQADNYNATNDVTFSSSLHDPGGGGGTYISSGYDSAYGRYSSLGNAVASSKMLPQVPLRHSSSVLDGMYAYPDVGGGSGGCGSNQQQNRSLYDGSKQPPVVAPPAARSRMLPHPNATAAGGGFAGNALVHQPLQQLNGYGCPRANRFNNVRVLPQPHFPPRACHSGNSNSFLKFRNFQDSTSDKRYDEMTINQNNQNVSFPWSNTETKETIATPFNNSGDSGFEINNIYQRPHTSMAPYNYYYDDGDGEYDESGFYVDDNLSTYSDIPIASYSATANSSSISAAAQQNLQHQRKLSLMMAMTTASVIASGETRIVANKKKQEPSSQSLVNEKSQTDLKTDQKYTKYDVKDYELLYEKASTPTITTTTINSLATTFTSNFVYTTTNTTTRADSKLLTPTTTTAVTVANISKSYLTTETLSSTLSTSSVVRPTRARKLPKCLPTVPKTKKGLKVELASVTTTPVTKVSTSTTNIKQLPKLPISTNSNKNADADKTATQVVNRSSPIKEALPSINSPLSSALPLTTNSTAKSIEPLTLTHEISNFNNNSSPTVNNNLLNSCISNSNSIDQTSTTSVATPLTFSYTTTTSVSLISSNLSAIITSSPSYSRSTAATTETTLVSTATVLNSDLFSYSSLTGDIYDYLKPYTLITTSAFTTAIGDSNENYNFSTTTSALSSTITTTTTTPYISTTLPDYINSFITTTTASILDICNNSKNEPVPVTSSFAATIIITTTTPTTTTTTTTTEKIVPNISTSFISPITSYVFSLPSESLITSSFSKPVASNSFEKSSEPSYNDFGVYNINKSTTEPLINDIFDTTSKPSLVSSPKLSPLAEVITTTLTEPINVSLPYSITTTAENFFTPTTKTTDSTTDLAFKESYADYLKKFELPELPPLFLPTNIEHNDEANVNAQMKTYSIIDELNGSAFKNIKDENLEKEDNKDFNLSSYTGCSTLYESVLNDNNLNLDVNKNDNKTELISTTSKVTPILLTDESTTEAIATPTNSSGVDKDANSSYDSYSYSDYLKHDTTSLGKYAWNVIVEEQTTITTTPTTTETIATTAAISTDNGAIEKTYTAVTSTANISTAFDDSFYDSFKVDLDTLTAKIPTEENTSIIAVTSYESSVTTTAYTQDTSSFSFMTTTTDFKTTVTPSVTTTISQIDSVIGDVSRKSNSSQSGYYRPTNVNAKSSTTATVLTTSSATPKTTTSKASSVFSGFSKGIKGSILDGVLTGVSASVASGPQQSQQQSSKKAFGFNLASKLVPNVGGLLSGNKDIPPSTTASTAKTITTSSNEYNGASTHVNLSYGVNESESTSVYTTTATNNFDNTYIDHRVKDLYDNAGNTDEHQGAEALYYVQDGDFLYEEDYGTGAADVVYNNKQETGTAGYVDEYGVGIYGEYDAYNNVANIYTVGNESNLTTQPYSTSSTTTFPYESSTALVTASSSISLDSKKSTETKVLSALASVTSTTQQEHTVSQNQQKLPILQAQSKPSIGGSVFGSFLGKAAAAMQSATQAVNQGAAAIVHQQKIPATTAASLSSSNAYSSQTQQEAHQHHDSLLSLHTIPTVTKVTAAGTDYENSNMVVVYDHDVANATALTEINTNNYYSNGNQNQPPVVSTSKILPTVPVVTTTGKKLPTIINGIGKSGTGVGYLIKQQPTEIYDDDEDVVDEYPNGDDSGQSYYEDGEAVDHLNHYYAQHQTAYKDGISGGYDYREDYFDEEDEYKYLAKEAQAEQEKLYQQQKSQQHKLQLQHQKRSTSIDFNDESQELNDEETIHDDYHSEDSGNYLDESSSGSVDGMVIKSTTSNDHSTSAEQPIPAARSNLSAAHIKRENSIIMEEDEDFNGMGSPMPATTATNPITVAAKAAFRRKSSDIGLDEDITIAETDDKDDQLGELPMTQRKKKVLIRGETEEVVSGHMQMMKRQKPQPEITSKQRWHWAYNKIIMQLNVSKKPVDLVINYCRLEKYVLE